MLKTMNLAAALALGSMGVALAQSPAVAPKDLPANGGPGVRAPYITSTGATVPDPGASQGAGVTPMDRGITERDNKIDSSICKGC